MDNFGPEPADTQRAQTLLEKLVDRPINRSLQDAMNRSTMTGKQMYALLGVVQQVVRMGVPLSPTIFRKSRAMARKLLKNKRFWDCIGGHDNFVTLQAMEQWLAAQIPPRGSGRAPLVAPAFRPPSVPAHQPRPSSLPASTRSATRRLPAAPSPRGRRGARAQTSPLPAPPPSERDYHPDYTGPMSDENFDLGELVPHERPDDDDDDKPRVTWGARD